MKTAAVCAVAQKILAARPDPIPKLRTLRDVLWISPDDPVFFHAKQVGLSSKWVRQLAEAQDENGIWGRFHTRDSKRKMAFATTEIAIQRALALGLEKEDDILKKAMSWIVRCLQGSETWSDRVERSEGWATMTRAVTASTLARIDPRHPILESEWQCWAEIAVRTFSSGSYDPDAERQAHLELHGLKTTSYYRFNVLHPLMILSSSQNCLPEPVERSLVNWVFCHPGGIYYVTAGRIADFPRSDERRFAAWLESLHILARFRTGKERISEALQWLESLSTQEGWWEYHTSPAVDQALPLSESWRRPLNKKIDCTVNVLSLLRTCL